MHTGLGYIDYSRETLGPHPALTVLTKRMSFEHENELRALVCDLSDLQDIAQGKQPRTASERDKGVNVDVSIQDLLRAVAVGPKSEPWFGDLVKTVTQARYGLDVQVERSTLYDPRVL